MLTIDQARDVIARNVRALEPVEVGVTVAVGLRLAGRPIAMFDLPPADVSVMDGYAVRTTDLDRGPLPIAAQAPAGSPRVTLPVETAARIQTGAALPLGADVVVPQEKAVIDPDGRVRLPRVPAGSSIRRQGEIVRAGDCLADAGVLVSPQLIGLIAGAGASTVRVIPRPRVAIVTTGSELVGLHESPGNGRIRDSNAAMLHSLASGADLSAFSLDRVPDRYSDLRNAIGTAKTAADVVVTSGGVSVGDYDLVREAVEEEGGEILLHRIAVRPGKPTLCAKLGPTWVIGLPGNPLSALVMWHLLVRPLVQALSGDPAAFESNREVGILTEPASNPGERTTFAPALAQGGPGRARVRLIPWKGSHDLLALSRANSLAILHAGAEFRAESQIELVYF